MTERTCADCRESLLADDSFCSACGAPNPAATGAGLPSLTEPGSNAAKANPGVKRDLPNSVHPEPSDDGSAKRSTQRTALITSAIVLLVALVGTIAFLAGRSGRSNEAVVTMPPAEQQIPVTQQSAPPSSVAASTSAPQADPATTIAPSTSVAPSADDFDSMYLAFLVSCQADSPLNSVVVTAAQ